MQNADKDVCSSPRLGSIDLVLLYIRKVSREFYFREKH